MEKRKYLVGLLFAKLFPHKIDEAYNTFTIPHYMWENETNGPLVERGIRFYLAYKAKRQEHKIPTDLEIMHKNFWRKADAYYSNTKSRTETVHIPAYDDIVQRLTPLLKLKNIQTVCEFGAGDGSWLNHLSQQWTFVKEFIGVDLSVKQVERNVRMFPHLTFFNSDLQVWVEKNATHHTLYHTCGGVLEYLSENSVQRLFMMLRKQAKGSILFFIEPLHGNYDINKDTASEIISYEHSYTHNYIHLLERAGIEVIRHEERESMGFRMLIVVASINE